MFWIMVNNHGKLLVDTVFWTFGGSHLTSATKVENKSKVEIGQNII